MTAASLEAKKREDPNKYRRRAGDDELEVDCDGDSDELFCDLLPHFSVSHFTSLLFSIFFF